MKNAIVLVLALAFIASIASSQERKSSIVGTLKIHESVPSKFLPSKHNVAVWLPPGYDDDKRRRYPVFYMGDGQNLFDGKKTFLPNKEWRMDESAEALVRAGLIEPIIIVGIDNGGMERANEYLPFSATYQGNKMGGQADQFVKMMVEEIKPMIDKSYRIKQGPQNTAIGGSSFGGIMALHVSITRPDVFGKAAVCSPAIWFGDSEMVKRIGALPSLPKVKVWVDMGTAEGANMIEGSNALIVAMKKKGWVIGKDLAYFVDQDAIHNEDAWAHRVPSILMFLFGKS
jgi:predicted alpha/beta superfamily hydrolase